MKKKILYLAASCVFSIGIMGCSGKSDSETNQTDSVETSQNVFSFNFKDNGYTGVYQFTDEKGVTCTLNLKDDNTFTAQSSKSDDVKTGKWSVYNNECPKLSFDDIDDPMFFTFPEGKEEKIKQTINEGVISEDGYIYALNIYYDAKKEEKRLPIRRVN